MTKVRDVVVGIDMGTTATKVVAYGADGRALAGSSSG
jgi:gluconokinase